MIKKIFKDHQIIGLNINYKNHDPLDISEYKGIELNSVDIKNGFLNFIQNGKHKKIDFSSIHHGCFYEIPDKYHYMWFEPGKNIAVEYFPEGRQKPKTYSIF